MDQFFKVEENINNQFNLIDIDRKGKAIVRNYRYFKDKEAFVEYTPPEVATRINSIKEDLESTLSMPENYIDRRTELFNVHQINEVSSYDFDDSLQALLRLKKVILLSDAGTGKSYEIRKIAFKLLNANMSYIPILIKLNRYNGESIMDMIPEEYKGFENEKLVLLLDGYDEIESTKISDFGRAIFILFR